MPATMLHHSCFTSHIRPCCWQAHRHAGALFSGAAQLRGTPLCIWTARRQVCRQWFPPPRRRHGSYQVVSAAAGRDYYGLLGVPRDAVAKDIKAAFRKKALKLHPDVNKAPDAKEQFMAAKEAFQVLSDADARARYDRQQRGGGGFDWGRPFGSGSSRTANSDSSAPGSGERRKKQEEEFYGFGSFFSDLEREWGERRKRRQKEPSSLWEELADLGEEFVEFLERELGLPPIQAEEAARNSSAASRNAAAAAAAGGSQRAEAASNRAHSDAQSAAKTAEQEAAAAKDEVEDMLAELKRKMGQ